MNFFLNVFYLFFISISLIGCQSDLEKKESFMKKAVAYHEKKEYRKEEIELKNALQIDPGYIKAYHLLAENMLKLGNIKESAAVYNRILQLDAEDIDANLKIAEFLVLGKNVDAALEKISFVLEKQPGRTDALLVKGLILMQKGYYDGAEKAYQTILANDAENIPAIQGMAKIHAVKKDFHGAEALLLKSIALDEQNLQVRMSIIGLYMQQNRLDDVKTQLETAIEKSPDNFEAHVLLGNFYFNQKQNDKAEALYLDAVKASPSSVKPYLVAAEFYEKIHQGENALKMYTEASSLEPDNVGIKETIARFHYSRKDIESADKIISAILAQRPRYYPARMLKSEILIYEKKFTEALQLLEELEKEEPNAPRTHYFKGLCFIAAGNYGQAEIVVSKACELNPGYFMARMLLADIYLRGKSFDLAHKEASTALKLKPDDYQARMIRAGALLGLGKMDEAQKEFEHLIRDEPDNPSAYYQMGLIKNALRDYDASLTYLKTAYEKNNRLIDVFAQMVNIHAIRQEYETAHSMIEKQIDLYKDQPALVAVVHNIQSAVFLAQKDPEHAKQALNRAIEANPAYLSPYETLAKFFLSENNKEKAIEQYQIIIDKNPRLPAPYMMIGVIYDRDQEYLKAAEYYARALEANPDFAPAANNLAYHLVKRTDEVDKALRLAQTAKAKLPEDPSVMDTLGLAYYRKGLYGNAVNEFLGSLNKMPDHPLFNYHLGMAYAKKGDKDLAIGALKKALESGIRFEEVEEAEQMLSELQK